MAVLQGFMAGVAVFVSAACSSGTSSAFSTTSMPPSSSSPGTPASTPSPSPSSSPPPSDPQQPIDTSPPTGALGYAAVCGGTGSPGAAPYAGPGPHPVDFEGDAGFYEGEGTTDVSDDDGTLLATSAGDIEPAGWAPASAARVQLVACVTTDFTATKVGACRYDTGPVALDAARYTLTLYAARTGRKLAGPVTVQGSDRTCPATAITAAVNPAVFTSLGLNQIEAIIGKYVQ